MVSESVACRAGCGKLPSGITPSLTVFSQSWGKLLFNPIALLATKLDHRHLWNWIRRDYRHFFAWLTLIAELCESLDQMLKAHQVNEQLVGLILFASAKVIETLVEVPSEFQRLNFAISERYSRSNKAWSAPLILLGPLMGGVCQSFAYVEERNQTPMKALRSSFVRTPGSTYLLTGPLNFSVTVLGGSPRRSSPDKLMASAIRLFN